MNWLDRAIAFVAPSAGLKRAYTRNVLRSFQGAETSRLTNKNPKNQSADGEMRGPFGADKVRAWGRDFVRNNAWAWGIVDTIVSSVVGNGIMLQSTVESESGEDQESVNKTRMQKFEDWSEVCDLHGDLTFSEIQALAQREVVEAGECLVRFIRTPSRVYRGINRPVPLALELIEADRLALDYDAYRANAGENRIVRGVEIDEHGTPVAYWIYPEHPNSPNTFGPQKPERIPANEVCHLFRKDRIGQTRGVSWFAPVMQWIRDLGVYVDNELQASAVSACFSVLIKSDQDPGDLSNPDGKSTDKNGNPLDYIEPGLITRLKTGEDAVMVNPTRPNANAEAWIRLMLRGVAVGTGLSYEVVARDYSGTSYSSCRTSQLEDRRRFRRWQKYLVDNLCMPVWDEFCNAAARQGLGDFPTSSELLDDRRVIAKVEWQTQTWEWVDPISEQTAAHDSVADNMSTLSYEVGQRGGNWIANLRQRAKEEKKRRDEGLWNDAELNLIATHPEIAQQLLGYSPKTEDDPNTVDATAVSSANIQATALNGAQVTSLVDVITQVGTGAMPKDSAMAVIGAAFPMLTPEMVASIIEPIEPGSISADGVPQAAPEAEASLSTGGVYMGLSTQQWNRNRKAIQKTLDELTGGTMSEAAANVFLLSTGMPQEHVDVLIKDAQDGAVETKLPEEQPEAANVQ